VTLLIAVSTALSAGLLVALVLEMIPARSRAVKAQMIEMGLHGLFEADEVARRARQRSKLKDLLHYLGEQMEGRRADWGSIRRLLIRAGYRSPSALPLYLGIRLGGTAVLGLYGFLLGMAADVGGSFALACMGFGAWAGWLLPGLLVKARFTRRKKELQKALPDAVDLLVICVEAGLGLNQAMVRVAEEVRHVSRLMTEELALTNSAIRAGTPRDQALMELFERTGLPDIRSLVTMVIQTDRFGTSIAHSLRIHSDTMRTKRRQRAEEDAAKTTIKMVFPLAFCIFPALFVVVLGPALISAMQSFSQM
jgi:tight adherence protein C